jgi:biopolymer transport protein ExbD
MSAKLKNAMVDDSSDMKMDMSPMIDMVFLLLIFFMVASNMITIQLDPKVDVPDARYSKVDDIFKGRILINIHADGKMYGIDGDDGPELDEVAITEMASNAKEIYAGTKTTVRLFIRADKGAPVRSIKKATKAAGIAGVNNVMFTSYLKSKD